jgi:hypothetical protein
VGCRGVIGQIGVGNPIVPDSACGCGYDSEWAAGVAAFTFLEEVVWAWGAVQHFAETSGLDASASAKWAGFELHRGLSIAWSVCFLPFGVLVQRGAETPMSYRGDLSTDRNPL